MTTSTQRPNAYPLPLMQQGISAAWVTAALRTRYPDVLVTEIDPLEIITGTATEILIRLTYDPHTNVHALPDTMWIKGGFAAHREYVGALGIYAGEVRFFNEIAPLYELSRPKSYFGLAQSEPSKASSHSKISMPATWSLRAQRAL